MYPKKEKSSKTSIVIVFSNEFMAVCHVIRKGLLKHFTFGLLEAPLWNEDIAWVSQKPSNHPASYVLVLIQLTASMYRYTLSVSTYQLMVGHSEISGHFKRFLLNEPPLHLWGQNSSFEIVIQKRHISRVKSDLLHPLRLHSGKLTWQWKIIMFNREYIFKRSTFHCHLSLPGGNTTIFRNHTLNLYQLWISLTSIHG